MTSGVNLIQWIYIIVNIVQYFNDSVYGFQTTWDLKRLSSKSKAWDFSSTSLRNTYGFLPISTPSGDWLPSFLLVNSSPKHTHANTQTYTCTPHCLPGQSRVEYSHMALSPWPSQLVRWLELGQSQCSIPQGTKCGLKPGRQIKADLLRSSVAIPGTNDRT